MSLAVFLLTVIALAGIGLYSLSLFRDVARDVERRTQSLPLSAEMSADVAEMRAVVGELRGMKRPARMVLIPQIHFGLHAKFRRCFEDFKATHAQYARELQHREHQGSGDRQLVQEWETCREIDPLLKPIAAILERPQWFADDRSITEMEDRLSQLRAHVEKFPGYLHAGLTNYSRDIRRHYQWLFGVVVGTTVAATVLLGVLLWLLYRWIFSPLRVLIDGSRQVAAGTFQHRILLQSNDEMAELAAAMNSMTARFEEIRDDLDRQVRLRTQDVIRNEQLASVGFLAAGVAHEINNPLASIAMSAESLQNRLKPLLEQGFGNTVDTPDAAQVLRFLSMIQEEAFRCKGITEKLLDLSRTGSKPRETTDLAALIRDLVEMLSRHGHYKGKRFETELPEALYATVNPQEIKQVLLNLMINALDFIGPDGTVHVVLRNEGDRAVVEVRDDGAGMSEEVLAHVFEPFFTRRRQGRGTGLGLSISHRIISDHGGKLEAFSPGPGHGSTFRIELEKKMG